MEPAYHEGQVVLIERLTPYIDVWRGEVLVLRNPHDKNVTEIKRVIGLPDETVDMGGDGITVTDTDGRSTKYETGSVIGGTGNAPYRIHLGPEDYFVLGDNRSKSSDSRTFGAVQKSDVIGRVLTTL
jgi:signal peptidase I